MSFNLAEVVQQSAATHNDRAALKLDQAELSYSALIDASERVAGVLTAKGVRPGDRVGVMLPNVPYFAAVYYGVLRVGATVVPMNPLLKAREVAFYVGDSGATVLFAWHGFAEAAHAGTEQAGADCVLVEPGAFEQLLGNAEPVSSIEHRAAGDVAVLIYTSGTTGTPKGAQLTHSNLRMALDTAVSLFDFEPGTVALGALPLFHVFGMTCALNATIATGGCLTLLPRFDAAKALEIIERDRVRVFEGVPTMYSAILAVPDRERYDTSTLELCVSGGAAMPVEVMREFEQTFGCKVLEGYGLSETASVASFNRRDRERKAGSIGTPVDGVEIKLVDSEGNDVKAGEPGEIALRGANVMSGYWKRPDASREAIDADGWFLTGDIAKVDEDGYFFIVDRKKDMIIRGGYNIYPREIEDVLYEHPAVREAAVIGIPHEQLGEEVGAAVAVVDGEDVDPAVLRDFVKERVAAYKYPRQIWIVDELPKGPTGKIAKRQIKMPLQ
jgi:long-chain acyl-CoA synthetase